MCVPSTNHAFVCTLQYRWFAVNLSAENTAPRGRCKFQDLRIFLVEFTALAMRV